MLPNFWTVSAWTVKDGRAMCRHPLMPRCCRLDLCRKGHSRRLGLSTALPALEVQGGRRVGLGRKLSLGSRWRVVCLLVPFLLEVDWVGWVSVFAYVIVVPCLMALLFVKQRAVMRPGTKQHPLLFWKGSKCDFLRRELTVPVFCKNEALLRVLLMQCQLRIAVIVKVITLIMILEMILVVTIEPECPAADSESGHCLLGASGRPRPSLSLDLRRRRERCA